MNAHIPTEEFIQAAVDLSKLTAEQAKVMMTQGGFQVFHDYDEPTDFLMVREHGYDDSFEIGVFDDHNRQHDSVRFVSISPEDAAVLHDRLAEFLEEIAAR